MSHIFSLDQLAQHKVCLDFSDSERPPSVQWHALSKPFDSRSPSSSLSIRIDASKLNGGNTLTLFVVEDSETPVAGPSRRSSAPPQEFLTSSNIPIDPSAMKMASSSPSVTPMDICGVNCQHNSIANHTMPTPTEWLGQNTSTRNTVIESGIPINPSTSNILPNFAATGKPGDEWWQFISLCTQNDREQGLGNLPTGMTQPQDAHSFTDFDNAPSTMIFGSEVQPWLDSEWSQSLAANTAQSSSSIIFDTIMTPSTPSLTADRSSPQSASCFSNLHTPPNNYHILPKSTATARLPSPPFSVESPLESQNAPSPDSSASEDGRTLSHGKSKFSCNLAGCQRTFKNEYTYRVHSRVHSKREKKRFECETCEETFSRRHDMMRHEVSQHGKVPEWTCHRCRRFFSSKIMLEDHKCVKTPRGVPES